MSLFGAARKTSTFQRAKERAKELEKKEVAGMTVSESAATDESSHIGEVLERHNEITGLLPTDPDGTATTSEIAREELGDYLGVQPAAVTLTREQYNQGVRIHNAEVRAEGHPSQVIEPIWRENSVVTRPAGGMSADHAIIQEGNNYLPVLLITIRPYRSVPTHSPRYSGHLTSGA